MRGTRDSKVSCRRPRLRTTRRTLRNVRRVGPTTPTRAENATSGRYGPAPNLVIGRSRPSRGLAGAPSGAQRLRQTSFSRTRGRFRTARSQSHCRPVISPPTPRSPARVTTSVWPLIRPRALPTPARPTQSLSPVRSRSNRKKPRSFPIETRETIRSGRSPRRRRRQHRRDRDATFLRYVAERQRARGAAALNGFLGRKAAVHLPSKYQHTISRSS